MTHEEDLRRIEKVRVLKSGELVGELLRTDRGAEFVYDESFRKRCIDSKCRGVACALPPTVQRHPVTGVNLHPFFAGLLPEGLRLKAPRNSLKTSEDDLFTMLIALGGESIGDVYIETEGQFASEAPSSVLLESADFNDLLKKSIELPLNGKAVDIGVPGVMPKLSASMISFPVRVKDRRKAYILKLQPEEYPQLIENEHFFLRMARACGLTAAEAVILKDSKGQSGLLVTRFDRYFDKGTKSIQKLHQEDTCQILGAYPHDKYRLSARSICEGIARYASAPIVDIKNFIDLYAFSYIIGNGNLHAKNVSLVELEPAGAFVVSPCYDLVSTLPYGDRRMAVPLGGRDDSFRIEDFVAFGKQFDIPEKAIRRSLGKMVERAAPWLSRLAEIGLEKKELVFLTSSIKKRLDGMGYK